MLPGICAPPLFKGGIGGIDAFTMLLLHMDGVNNGATFLDSSTKNKSINVNSTTTTSTANPKFGTASLSLGAAASYLNILHASGDPDFTFGTGDATVDFWANPSGATGVIYNGGGGVHVVLNMVSNKINFIANGTIRLTSTTTLSNGTYYHVAWVRASGTSKLYINGTSEGGSYADANNYAAQANRPIIGNNESATNRFLGTIDELRVSKGIARWTANFTPPAGPYSL
jgi:hypothetical protein